jgi:hypothetical protein
MWRVYLAPCGKWSQLQEEKNELLQCCGQHRFDADPEPEPDPDPDWHQTMPTLPKLLMLENLIFF